MKNTRIDFATHRLIAPIVTDYISGSDFLKPFYKYPPSPGSVPAIITDKSKEKINRHLLVEILTKQYSALKKSEKVENNISLLLSEKTFTVTTGHQLNLFTGPLYFIYKILTTIQLADELSKKYPEHNFIPVYWMASEDHDFAEINHIHLFGEKIEWNGADAKNFGGPSGKLGTQGISAVIEKVKKKIEREPGSVKVIDLLQKAYLNHDNLADATRYLVNELFGKYGLVVMDANEKNFKQHFSEVMTNDLIHHSAFKLVNETSKQLEVRYEVQVHPREINLFYMTGGSRKRITNDGEKYLQEMETSPENFSPNVVLRPLYQEMLLPNIAMVGGPAEIAYWLQYKKMFEHYGVNFPMLVPRKSCLWIDEKSSEAMRKLKIKTEELFDSADELISRYLADITMHRNSLEKEEQKIFDAFDELARKISETDPTLQATVEAERDKLLDAIERVEAKFIKADKIKHDTAIQKIKKLKEKLFPEGTLQERYENFIPYYLKYGDGFFEMLLANGEVFDFKLNVLAEDNRQ